MIDKQTDKAVLLLADGRAFTGVAIGKRGTCTGEICFNTGMTGYQEVFTDPSYFGQIMVTTNAHIGNYGTRNEDCESNSMQIAGLVCKNFTSKYSRPMADEDIQTYFEREGLTGISDIDTRSLVRHIRSTGAMNAIISSEILDIDELQKKLDNAPSMEGLELASKVSTDKIYDLGDSNADIKVAVLDYGTKRNILRCMTERGCQVRVFPAKTDYEQIAKWNPDGFFLSNGPGDPASMDYAITTIKEILKNSNKPVFGICLGHQLLALAMDVPTYKMHHGHRGINHPVKNLVTGKCEVTSQNHGFGVSVKDLEGREDIETTHVNLNDDTVEGIRLTNKNAFSVQYHPEASPGPHDSRYLFDDFVKMITTSKVQNKVEST